MIAVTAYITARPGRENALKAQLEAVIDACAHQEGLILYSVHQSLSNPAHFVFYEQFASQEALDKHAASEELRRHHEATKDMVLERSVETWQMLNRACSQ